MLPCRPKRVIEGIQSHSEETLHYGHTNDTQSHCESTQFVRMSLRDLVKVNHFEGRKAHSENHTQSL